MTNKHLNLERRGSHRAAVRQVQRSGRASPQPEFKGSQEESSAKTSDWVAVKGGEQTELWTATWTCLSPSSPQLCSAEILASQPEAGEDAQTVRQKVKRRKTIPSFLTSCSSQALSSLTLGRPIHFTESDNPSDDLIGKYLHDNSVQCGCLVASQVDIK